MDDQRRFVSVKEAAAILGMEETTIRSLLRRGEMPGAVKIGRVWRIRLDSLDNLGKDLPPSE